ncbi:MAG: peptide-methionine (S)-S-oxide reductase [Candidatus Omnitrophica bacterium CG11_big_fil_rev_8_21_14_0_20_45_26]|uniref:Peptide methionine sulfoxide reductase MsrA n=1 Tax=Candidatus Abzuiibacterium crystallinum TaxID=1974748 RepID=A0A2H0LL62_9BACT|nr:MAG: peptide-methionine (S)-S-oxide reductase [Candidatus Omnitrophica bacterium CG11_big_fil_rev_8_21_14_0_20_45_26]PIW64006.1 MAG: peptide-methionine (S)-S-oxide reductase [Candidatus Omnitrophica bacterium CG12_big_fil_rev_8_21_14_0_65_45_16]
MTQPDQEKSALETITFAGGCFWCMEPPFENLEGVVSVTSGYMGGHVKNPTYEQVCEGGTGHAEVVQVVYDPSRIGFEKLLKVFWMNIDPTTVNQQFADHGDQYRTAIFYHTEEQKRLAETSKAQLAASGRFNKPIVTEMTAAGDFYPAENYHQDYYKKNPYRYKFYRIASGRDLYIHKKWGTEAKEH